jgi:hypothetical protein
MQEMSLVGLHALRQVLSTVRQTSPVAQVPLALQVDSDWVSHTATPSATTQWPPFSQSTDLTQALWQAPNLHRRGSLQSLLRMQVPPRSNFSWLLPQAARMQANPIQHATRIVFIALSSWDRNSLLGTGLAIAAQCRQIDFLGFVQHAVQALATDAQGLRRAFYVAAGCAQGRERFCHVGVSNIGARDRRCGRG